MQMFGSVVPLRAPLLAALFVCAAARANLQSVTAPWTTSEIRPPVLSGRPSPPLATAFVSNAEVPGGQTSSTALPPGQQQIDIGGPAVAGSAEYAGGTYTIRGAGTDIWDTADQFTFVYQPVSGNLEIVSRVASIAHPDVRRLASREPSPSPAVTRTVHGILAAVKREGHAAVLRYARKFDGLKGPLAVSASEIASKAAKARWKPK